VNIIALRKNSARSIDGHNRAAVATHGINGNSENPFAIAGPCGG